MSRPGCPALPDSCDLLVIGGGINGLAVARDAAIRGLSVLLVEKHDFGSATSSWSSRMIHGGLRYLEHLDLLLVRESLREREILFRTAPHLVKPMRLAIPVYGDSTRGRVTIAAGMLAYDLLSFDRSVPGHRWFSRARTIRELPQLRRDGLRGAAEYTDGQVELSERLCVEIALDAARHGARLANWTRVTGSRHVEGRRGPLQVELEGCAGTATVTASCVVNAAGPWVDTVLHTLGFDERLVGGTKGSHIALPLFDGAPDRAIHFETETGKPLLIIPWNGVLLVGSTDELLADGGDREPVISAAEQRHLVDQANRLFPTARFTDADIVFTYSGVRPLPHTSGATAMAISRRHHIHRGAHSRLLSLVGGKLTTHRALAEEVVDLVLATLGRPPVRSTTQDLRLPGAANDTEHAETAAALAAAGLPPAIVERLLWRYGMLAIRLLPVIAQKPQLASPLTPNSDTIAAEVVIAVTAEWARTMTDVLFRRIACALTGLTPALVEATARVLIADCGWTSEEVIEDVAHLRALADRLTIPLRDTSGPAG